jgi:acetyl-CoA carboxylase biotin carboxyl carrier protein
MKQTGVDELSVEQPDFKISIKRGGASAAPGKPTVEVTSAFAAEPVASTTGETVQVTAHMLGIFRHGDVSDPASRADVGDWVTAGQVLGTIEAMKVRSEVRSSVSGTVEEILVSDDASVEYGQPLFTILPKTEQADVVGEQA